MRELKDNPAPPIQLFRKEGDEYKPTLTRLGHELWACGECGSLHVDLATAGMAKQRSLECCLQTKCVECGDNKDSWKTLCNGCDNAASDKRRHDNAELIELHDGWIYVEGYGSQEGYFADEESLRDWIDNHNYQNDNPIPMPEFAFVCTEKHFSHIDMRDVVDNELEEFYEDAIDKCDIDPLQKFVDEWVKEQGVISYDVDYSRKIKLWS